MVLAALTAIRVILLWRWNEQVVVKNGGGGGRRDVGRLGKETWREENGDAMFPQARILFERERERERERSLLTIK